MSRNTLILSLALVALIASALLVSTRFDSIAVANEKQGNEVQKERDFTLYQVRAGDNLYRLSQDTYGSPRLWTAIAKENNINNAFELKAGQTIKIPALSRNEIEAAAAPVSPLASQDSVPPVGKSSPHPDADKVAEADADNFDASAPHFHGALKLADPSFENAFATVAERNGKAYLRISAVRGDFHEMLFDDEIAPIGGTYRFAFASDTNQDGNDELYTVWKLGSDEFFTQEVSFNGRAFTVSAAHPASPFAMRFEPEALSQNAELMNYIRTMSNID
ncbi:MAG: LysM peptidoglycan-binding domain-containing protein [Planctomycetes bacterium]|nr:LysM peptidoglycan-binding domain-containing protein [Planctomycetota bacterium]